MKQIVTITTTLASVLLLFASCSNPVGSTQTADCGPGVIIPGVCIDGVKLGDSRERVEELLGEPSGIGWADGVYRGWRSYRYKPPGTEGTGLTIRFFIEKDGSWGPVDMLRLAEPYDGGKTPENIGLGSTFKEVRQAYGEPDYISEHPGNNSIQSSYYYCINSRRFALGGLDGVVERISFWYFIPLEQDTSYLCT
jgi:hypothetical protein